MKQSTHAMKKKIVDREFWNDPYISGEMLIITLCIEEMHLFISFSLGEIHLSISFSLMED